MEKNNNINVIVRMDKNKIEELKNIAKKRSDKEKIHISYNDLIIAATYKEYFNEKK